MVEHDEDIERLKTNKLPPREARPRRHLPTLGVPKAPEPDIEEAVGGSGEAPPVPVDAQVLEARVVDALKTIFDPEIPVNIYDLGLIYGIEVDAGRAHVEVQMTLTAPACPVAGILVQDTARKVGDVEGVATSHVQLVWDPPWTKERMSEEAMLELGLL